MFRWRQGIVMKNDKKIKKNLRIIVLLIVFVSIVPLLLIGKYNHPSADDFGYSVSVKQGVENNASTIEIVKIAIDTSKEYMNKWQGLYTSAFLLALQPAVFGEQYYALTTIIMLLVIAAGVFALIYSIVHNVLQSKCRSWYVVAAILFMYIIQGMPDPVEGLFWFNGAVNYLFFWGLFLVNISILISYFNKDRAYISLLISFILSFLISGGNHITGFVNIMFVCCIFAYSLYKKRRILIVFSLVSAILGFVVNLTAPGTAIRMVSDGVSNPSVIKTVVRCGYQSLVSHSHYFTFTFLILLLVLTPFIIDLIRSTEKKIKIDLKVCFGIVILDFVIIAAMYCLPYYAMGVFGEGRVENTIFATYTVLMVITYSCLVGYLQEYALGQDIYIKVIYKSENNKLVRIGLAAIIVCMVSYIAVVGNGIKDYSTGMKALTDMSEAKMYDMEYQKRMSLINDESVEDVVIEAFKTKPYLLFFSDIERDCTHWKNKSMASYYKKNTISLEK